ncbi:hypothetical protein [Bordetella bronchialis]|uniref:Uncharacterized protein n=1 Tax=Bordetella bronchialis TaxID=463025 RepID=A0A193FSR2_9BORD|nr:hypothetical protein [Bordetella bronchialis]ANN70358.1 hypothetical protein BAU08_02520 [Bordetella bronchialis]
MPETITSSSGGWAAALISASHLACEIGRADHEAGTLADGQASSMPASAPPANQGAGAAVLRSGSGIALRFTVDAMARASSVLAHDGDRIPAPAVHRKSKLRSAAAKAVGAAMTRLNAPRTDSSRADGASGSMARALTEEAGIRKRTTARIYLRGRPADGQEARAARTDASRPGAKPSLPSCSAALAADVAGQMRGMASSRASAYLGELAMQQMQCGRADLAMLANRLSLPAPSADDGAAPPETDLARQATGAWLLADCLRDEGRVRDGVAPHGGVPPSGMLPNGMPPNGVPPSGMPPSEVPRTGASPGDDTALFIGRLNRHVDAVLDTLVPEALWAVYRRLTVDAALSAGPQSSLASAQANTLFNSVGMSAARSAWAASQVCELIQAPLSPQEVGAVLRGAVAASKPDASHDEVALLAVAQDIGRLTIERCQYLMMRQLRVRAGHMLREKGIPINELVHLATTVLPQGQYAASVAGTLHQTLPPGMSSPDGWTARYPSDAQARQRLAAAVDMLSSQEILAAARNLLPEARHMRRLVQGQAARPAERAALGRQFTILCEVLADRLPPAEYDAMAVPALKALREWDWDTRLSHRASRPSAGGIAGLRRAVLRGLQRLSLTVLPGDGSDGQRLRNAYADVVKAASSFLANVEANTGLDLKSALKAARRNAETARLARSADSPAPWSAGSLRVFNESGARLMKAASRYDALCQSPKGKSLRAQAGLPGNTVHLLESAFFDALGGMAGQRVDVLGRTLFDPDWLNGLYGLQEMMHDTYQAGPRPAQSLVGRLFKRVQQPWQPPLGMAQAHALVFALQSTLKQESATRAAVEVLDVLAHRHADAAGGPDGTPTEADLRMLDDITALAQRFLPMERQSLGEPARASTGLPLDRFVESGMRRATALLRDQVRVATLDLDRRPPSWLAQDELWKAVTRYGQKAARSDAA